ncbi:hypothetical protein CDAR_387561 [Caerostris darwini]|uniref:Uncharacterized protein n=1 Tax=Caerostris darwini TaxID=1538125 RepID=A0AAV4TL68_9ARAC|nr:hypothetical protein CDAR_387561 [Caerostris darwini]
MGYCADDDDASSISIPPSRKSDLPSLAESWQKHSGTLKAARYIRYSYHLSTRRRHPDFNRIPFDFLSSAGITLSTRQPLSEDDTALRNAGVCYST